MTTASDYGLAGAHLINKWLWNDLQDLVWKDSDRAFAQYDDLGLVPFIPTQQVPELTNINGGAPFIVYNYTVNTSPQWWVTRETCAYVLYDNNEGRLRAIFGRMNDLLKRQDWTARNLNDFLGDSKFNFKYVSVTSATGPGNFTDEGGRQGAMVVASYEYTHDLDGSDGAGLRV